MGAVRTGAILVAAAVTCLTATSTASAADTYLDCETQALDSLGSPFSLGPGDRLLIKRGTVCSGSLRVSGGGNVGSPAEVGAFGSGELPRIIGTGQDAVLVENASNLTVRDLDLSNPGNGETVRNGIRVLAQGQVSSGVTVNGLAIHDVGGDLTKSVAGSAAVQVAAGGTGGRFESLKITGNRISSVSRSGISLYGTDDPDRPTADEEWPAASTGVEITGNRVDLIAGDGIVTRGTDGALIEANVVSRGNLAGRPLLDPEGPMCNAGIWAFRANNTLIRGNEVFGMKHNGCDGTGFDVDYRQDRTIIEGNFSHDNEGGFVLLCTDSATHRADVRFNLSVDDGTMINHGPCGIADGVLGDLSGIRMFNNTVVAASPTVSVQLGVSGEIYQPGNFRFENNLVFARSPIGAIPCGSSCSHNAFFGLPSSGTDAVTADPLLTADYRLGPDSPLHGAGVPVPDPGLADYFGNPIPARPSIGFDQAPVADVPVPVKPAAACLRSREARDRAIRKFRDLRRKLKRLRRNSAPPKKVGKASRRLRKARKRMKQLSITARKQCRASRLSG